MRKISPFGCAFVTMRSHKVIFIIIIFLLKVEYEGELRISESNLFHSTNADEKKKLRKKLFLTLNSAITKF